VHRYWKHLKQGKYRPPAASPAAAAPGERGIGPLGAGA